MEKCNALFIAPITIINSLLHFSVLNNYMVWQTVKAFTGCLSKAFRDAYKGLRKALIGSEGGDEPQWRYCVAETNNALGKNCYTEYTFKTLPNIFF